MIRRLSTPVDGGGFLKLKWEVGPRLTKDSFLVKFLGIKSYNKPNYSEVYTRIGV